MSFALIRYRDILLWTSRSSAVLLMYGVAASMAVASLATVLLLSSWALAFDWRRPWTRLRALPTFWPLLLLPLLIVVGTFHSLASFDYATRYFLVYSRFFVVIVILVVIDEPLWQRRCWIGFFAGVAVTLFSTYAGIWVVLPWSHSKTTGLGVDHSVFFDYIAQGVMTSFFVLVAYSHALTEDRLRLRFAWVAAMLLGVFSVTHLLQGRTGQLVCLISLMVVTLIALPRKRAAGVLLACASLAALLIWTSPVIVQRFTLLVSEIQAYQQGQEMTSIGARLSMWFHSWHFYWDQPVFGHGTGSYRTLAERIYSDPVMCSISCVHPHNQFLFFGVEHGLPGLFLYLWLLVGIFQVARQVERRHALVLMGFLAILSVDSFINSPFWISNERNFYTAILGLTLTSFYLNRRSGSRAVSG